MHLCSAPFQLQLSRSSLSVCARFQCASSILHLLKVDLTAETLCISFSTPFCCFNNPFRGIFVALIWYILLYINTQIDKFIISYNKFIKKQLMEWTVVQYSRRCQQLRPAPRDQGYRRSHEQWRVKESAQTSSYQRKSPVPRPNWNPPLGMGMAHLGHFTHNTWRGLSLPTAYIWLPQKVSQRTTKVLLTYFCGILFPLPYNNTKNSDRPWI